MANMYGAGGGAPILGGSPFGGAGGGNILAALQQLMQSRQPRRRARRPMGVGPAAPRLIGPPVKQGPRLIGPPVVNPGDISERFPGPQVGVEPPGLGGQPGIPDGGLFPMPVPMPPSIFQQNAGNIRQGLLDLLHPNIATSLIKAKRMIHPQHGAGVIPQPNLKTAVPPTGPFHHNAFAGHNRRAQLVALRQQHVRDAQSQASQMSNMVRKSRASGRGPYAPRRAFYSGA